MSGYTKRTVLAGLPTLLLVLAAPALQAQPEATDLNDPAVDAERLAEDLATGMGTVSNVSFTGDNRAAGIFAGLAESGLEEGVILSSGEVEDNMTGGLSSNLGQPGDGMISDALGESNTNDAAILEFDLQVAPGVTELEFDIVLVTNEAPGSFNDGFALWVNGTNCALFPDGSPMTQSNMADFEAHGFGSPLPGGPRVGEVQRCSEPVDPASTNSIRLAVADVGDHIVDTYALVAGVDPGPLETCDPEDPNASFGSDNDNQFFFEDDTNRCIDTGSGNNQLMLGTGNDVVFARTGNNNIIFKGGDNFVRTRGGTNFIIGGPGDDEIHSEGEDWITLLEGGNNRVTSTSGRNHVLFGPGDDHIEAGPGDHRIIATGGDNHLEVGEGESIIVGGSGQDTCIGPPETTIFIRCEIVNPEE